MLMLLFQTRQLVRRIPLCGRRRATGEKSKTAVKISFRNDAQKNAPKQGQIIIGSFFYFFRDEACLVSTDGKFILQEAAF
ncbi:MAG: hypothetical protein CVV24_10565 [Ignavibacteriae bacterium HGW-Ignavibacteriae-3]|nr:MAG: hypothetical protein CVV24_10565 [Ignavibacteriae bacterium HGW-Ignavibacteriae-3]